MSAEATARLGAMAELRSSLATCLAGLDTLGLAHSAIYVDHALALLDAQIGTESAPAHTH